MVITLRTGPSCSCSMEISLAKAKSSALRAWKNKIMGSPLRANYSSFSVKRKPMGSRCRPRDLLTDKPTMPTETPRLSHLSAAARPMPVVPPMTDVIWFVLLMVVSFKFSNLSVDRILTTRVGQFSTTSCLVRRRKASKCWVSPARRSMRPAPSRPDINIFATSAGLKSRLKL